MSNIINNLKKSIYDCLSSQTSSSFSQLSGIFTYLEKNKAFPYIFISIENIEDNSTFSKNIYNYSVVIEIYDKNSSGNFVSNLAEDIKEIFANKSNLTSEYFSIIDIKYNKMNISLENDNTIWKSRIIFDFIISVN